MPHIISGPVATECSFSVEDPSIEILKSRDPPGVGRLRDRARDSDNKLSRRLRHLPGGG